MVRSLRRRCDPRLVYMHDAGGTGAGRLAAEGRTCMSPAPDRQMLETMYHRMAVARAIERTMERHVRDKAFSGWWHPGEGQEAAPIGATAARAAGMRLIALTTTHRTDQLEPASLIVPDLTHLVVRVAERTNRASRSSSALEIDRRG